MKTCVRALPWCLLALALWLLCLGMNFRMAEYSWVDVEAEVSPPGGNALQFYMDEWEPLSTVHHLSPPAGEPAWQPGQKVAISFYLPRGGASACLRADKPTAWSNKVEMWGYPLLIIGVPLAFVLSFCLRRRWQQSTPLADERPEPPEVGCLASVVVGLMRGFGYVCCFLSVAGVCIFITALHYDPEPDAVVVLELGAWLLAGVGLISVSRALLRYARHRAERALPSSERS